MDSLIIFSPYCFRRVAKPWDKEGEIRAKFADPELGRSS